MAGRPPVSGEAALRRSSSAASGAGSGAAPGAGADRAIGPRLLTPASGLGGRWSYDPGVADHDLSRTATGVDGRPLQGRGHRTRARLLAAGAVVFTEKSLHAARVDDIVRLAESSHGTFYLYFASKEHLFEEVIAEVTAEVANLVADMPQVVDTVKGRTALREWLDRLADLYERSGSVIRIRTEAEVSRGEIGRAGNDVLGAALATLMARMQIPAGSGLDAPLATLALVTMCERLNYYVATRQVKASRDEILTTLVDVTSAALFGT